MFRRVLFAAAAILSAALSVPLTFGQSTFGSVTGTVTDPSGAVIPAARVEVTNEGTGTTRDVTTSSAGVFNVPNLDIGTYKVKVTAKGFSPHERTGLHLTANQIVDLPISLTLGTTAGEVIEVQAYSPVITTEATDLSGSVGHDAMEELPSVGRHTGDGGVY